MRRSGPGAEYADARAVVRRVAVVATKNGRVEHAHRRGDARGSASACSSTAPGASRATGGSTGEGARDAALRACAFARAAAGRRRAARSRRSTPASGTLPHAGRARPVRRLARRQGRALPARRGGAGAAGREGRRQASVRAQREHKLLLSSDGAEVEQELVECGAGIDATAVARRGRPDAQLPERARRLERAGGLGVRRGPRSSSARRRASASRRPRCCRADACPAGVTTVVIDAEQMALQVHESVGHPTELDRVYGTEAAYAGTSFLKPGDLGSLRYGSEHMNITADPTTPRGLGTFGFDDEGVPARARADRRGRRAHRLPHLARDRGADRRRRRRLDARRRLEPDAARPHDEPPPRAGQRARSRS